MSRSVLVDGRLLGYRHGGISTYIAQLAERMPALATGLDIRFAFKRLNPRYSDRSVRAFTPPHHRFERFSFGLEVLRHSPDILHSVDYVQPVVRGTRTVVTIHDLAFLTEPERLTGDSWKYYSQVVETGPSADRVIAVSESTARQIVEHTTIDPGRIRVVPNGYDAGNFHEDKTGDREILLRLHPGLADLVSRGRPIVIAVGTLEPRKRIEILLSAFEMHHESITSLAGAEPMLVIVGQLGWLADGTADQIRSLQQHGRAIWLRDVRDRELAALYRLSTLLAMPSAEEGFGLPVLEAMACGTAALVSGAEALTDLVGDCGFIEKTDEPVLWADKIGRILADNEVRERRARRGVERASMLTWDETARRTVAVYREVLNEK